MNKLIVAIFTMMIITTFVFTGCSQENNKEDVPIPVANTMNTDNLSDIDIQLVKEVEADHSFEDPFIALDPYENAPLSAVVIFTTDEDTGVTINVLGHEESYDIEKQFDKGKKHIIPIYGLYAGEENKVLMTLDDGRTKELIVTTDLIEDPYNKGTVIKSDKGEMKDGLTFVSLGQKSPSGIIAAAYDESGEIRWALKGDVSAWDIYRLKNDRLLVSTSEKHSEPYYATGVREVDLMGKTYAEYIFPGGYHHSTVELPNGNFLVAAQEANSPTIEDIAYEINRDTGAIVKTFDLKDLLPMDDGSTLIVTPNDWFHNNSLWYDDKTNSIIFSGRNANAVISVDYETGKLKWILGDPEGWKNVDKNYFFTPSDENFEWQYAQHGSMLTPEGHVFLFDNGLFRAKNTNEENKLSGDENYSRGVIYKIDENNMTIKQVWQYGKELGSNWYSYYLGDVDYLSKNHYLINSGGQLYDTVENTHEVGFKKMMSPETKKSASIVEIKDNELLFEIIMDYNIYAAERMSIYTDKNNFELYEESKVYGNVNESKTAKYNKIDNEIQEILKDKSNDFQNPLIIQDPFDIAPLTAIAVFNTENEVSIQMTIVGDTEADTFNYKFPEATEHRLPIIGLYPDRENKVILKQISDEEIKEVKELKIKTEPLLKKYQDIVEVTNSNAEGIEGITVLSGGPVKSPYAFDSSGKIRWFLKIQTEGHGYFPMADGRFMIMTTDSMMTTEKRQYSTLLYNMDFLGRLHKIYLIPKGAHHEVIEKTPGGNLLVLSNSLANHVEDLVVEIDRETGKVVKELKLGNVIKNTYDENLDWAHMNSISYNGEDDSVILSVRDLSAGIKINWSTQELKWILSDPQIWEGTEYEEYVLNPIGTSLWHYEQHAVYEINQDIDNNPETLDVIMFDNRVLRNPLIDKIIEEDVNRSSVTQFSIDEKKGTVIQVKRFPNTLAYLTSNFQLFYDKDRIIAYHASIKVDNSFWGEIYEYQYSTGNIIRSYKTKYGFYRGYRQDFDFESTNIPMDNFN